jgi:hypothetical protein
MRFWRGKVLDDLLDKFSISSKKGLFFSESLLQTVAQWTTRFLFHKYRKAFEE